jgi:hypothetical protein
METKTINGKAIRSPQGKKRSGRIRANGYYAIYLPEHPYAFGKGYVYEHRHVVEQKLGRYLLRTEIVHHKDGNKLNNNIDNLELCASIAEHKAEHRSSQSAIKRMPNEPNIIIKCACGCGSEFLKYDTHGRERKYFGNGCAQRHKSTIKHLEQSKILVYCACGCEEMICKYDKYGRERKFISGHNNSEIPNRTLLAKETGLSFATIINYFKGDKLRNKTINLIENSIIKHYGKDYLRK